LEAEAVSAAGASEEGLPAEAAEAADTRQEPGGIARPGPIYYNIKNA
jgi:hypothetical protein